MNRDRIKAIALECGFQLRENNDLREYVYKFADRLIQAHEADDAGNYQGAGREALWTWFGLSYASWLTIPRVLLHAMPNDWQADMARLLNQYYETFTNLPDIATRVQLVDSNNKLIKTPDWIKNYRHPDRRQIESMKETPR